MNIKCDFCDYCQYPRSAYDNNGFRKCKSMKRKTIDVYVGGGEPPVWCPRLKAVFKTNNEVLMNELYNVTLTRDQIFDIIFAIDSRISAFNVCLSFLPSLDGNSDFNAAVSSKLTDLQKNLSDAKDLVEYLKKFIK